jgi:hypothetical protein
VGHRLLPYPAGTSRVTDHRVPVGSKRGNRTPVQFSVYSLLLSEMTGKDSRKPGVLASHRAGGRRRVEVLIVQLFTVRPEARLAPISAAPDRTPVIPHAVPEFAPLAQFWQGGRL